MQYKMCTRCVMDTSDPLITFDENGVCNHCSNFDKVLQKKWFPNEQGKLLLNEIFEDIRKSKRNEYDCVLGLSGGIDSSYLALILKDYGMNPLVVHVDAGWNSDTAVSNIEKIVNYCNFDLHTIVMDWEEIKDLQRAFLKSGVSNQDTIQDHAFFSSLYRFSVMHGVKYVISGSNIATESVLPTSWQHSAMDAMQIIDIHKKYGNKGLKFFKPVTIFEYAIKFPYINRMQVIKPLNYIEYSKKIALERLEREVGYVKYAKKHGESIFTKFYQNYILPERFGYDKRIAHLSSLILAGEITRAQALLELSLPLYDSEELTQDFNYVAKKLGFSHDELNQLIKQPLRSYKEFQNWDLYKDILKRIASFFPSKIKSY